MARGSAGIGSSDGGSVRPRSGRGRLFNRSGEIKAALRKPTPEPTARNDSDLSGPTANASWVTAMIDFGKEEEKRERKKKKKEVVRQFAEDWGRHLCVRRWLP
ncbi:hypothetical protein F2P81_014877 [Scophthalmus maximus]|uniref:Uncharacterized protein n=1 Tax=Scophthalmus maximus TaxID=52904 RepID=A0A6A4SH94_SCOMX|nr:hypothetical protein F2P81_014877 [Scophthalmus maximus]